MRAVLRTATAFCAIALAAHAQKVTVGVIGGTHLTNNFPLTQDSGPADAFGNPAYRFQFATGPRSFIFGATLEGRLSETVSIEANALHRPMKAVIRHTDFYEDGTSRTSTTEYNAVRAWEFPLLLKYTFAPNRLAPGLRPFLTAGPSFRTQEDAGAAEPSQVGITAGAGLTLRLGNFRVAPTFRYTRWRGENIAPRYATKPDQVEFLTSVGYETRSSTRRFGDRKVEIGALVGLPLTRNFPESGQGGPDGERMRYLAGLSAQVDMTERVGLEANAIYKPLRAIDRGGGGEHPYTVLTWQFPLLVKYSFGSTGWRPMLQAGPSLRLSGNLNGYKPSPLGLTVGAGLEKRAGRARVSPAVRYTRWRADGGGQTATGGARTNQDSVEAVLGLSF